MRAIKLFLLTRYLLLLVLLCSCTKQNEPVLRIGTNVWPGYEPLYLARSLGFYDHSQIKLVELTSASEVILALKNGNLEGAALTLDEALSVIDDGFALEIVLVIDFSNGADALLGKPEILLLDELKGKKIAVEHSAVGALLLDSALNRVALNVSDVELVRCRVDEHLNCFDHVDAIVTFEPGKTQLLNQGANVLFDSSQIPGKIIDVLAVSSQAQSPQAVEQLIAGYFKAINVLRSKPQLAAIKMSRRLKLIPEQVLAAYSNIALVGLIENHALLKDRQNGLLARAHELSELMQKNKLLNHLPSDKLKITADYLPQVQ